MEEEKNQQIIVFTDFSEKSIIALNHGKILAEVLEKELTMVCFSQNNEEDYILQQKMLSIAKSENVTVNTFLLKGKLAEAYNKMVPEINAILVIVCYNDTLPKGEFHPLKLLKLFHKSRIPYIFANNSIKDASYYKKIILPIDSTKESKEKVLWANYFGRFNESELIIMAATVKDEYLLRKLNNNLKFIKKIFDSFEVNYEIRRTTEKQHTIDLAAIHSADEEQAGLVIILSTRSYGIIDLIKGPKELKLICNKSNVSIMCLNQRDDLYVMCD
ncbi:MAG: hypothetical protein ACOYO1_15960 [Bacteroidales bacterium]